MADVKEPQPAASGGSVSEGNLLKLPNTSMSTSGLSGQNLNKFVDRESKRYCELFFIPFNDYMLIFSVDILHLFR